MYAVSPYSPHLHNESKNFANLILQERSFFQLFAILKGKSNSRYSLVHILPTSSSKSAPIHPFFAILKCKAISLKCKSGSGYSLVRILPTSSNILNAGFAEGTVSKMTPLPSRCWHATRTQKSEPNRIKRPMFLSNASKAIVNHPQFHH
jgi:hypothetical protein